MRNILIGFLVCAAGTTFAAPPVASPVVIVAAEFGLFDDRNSSELLFTPARVVPHRVGQRYGWIIEVATARRSLSVREEYVLPAVSNANSATDAVSESLTIASPRRNQVSQRELVPIDGKIYGEWSVGPNEPAGHRHLQVVVDDQVAASFEFDVK